jgi:hypothetical protein
LGQTAVAGRLIGNIHKILIGAAMFTNLWRKVTGKLDAIQVSNGHTFAVTKGLLERQLLLQGQIAARQVRQIERVATLADAEFRVTSQWGEDGIIEWLVHKLPNTNRSFIEFGVENFQEANTRFLLQNRGWRGLIIDGSSANMDYVRREALHWMFDLVAVNSFVTAENINDLIKQNGFAGELGILSVDIDGNDYWVLKAIDCVRPAILIAEYNSVLGDRHAITVPYEPAFERLKAHHSGQYFGASIKAMIALASEKGYEFVGTNSNGVNAFFIRKDLAGPVLASIASVKAWPARHRDSRDSRGALTYARGTAKSEQIATKMVHDIAAGKAVELQSLFPLYSPEWQQEI